MPWAIWTRTGSAPSTNSKRSPSTSKALFHVVVFRADRSGCFARLAIHSQRHPAGRPARPGARPFQDDDGRLHRRDPGTVWQAVLLGVTATISHTLIVWGIGLGGMYLWRGVAAEALGLLPAGLGRGHRADRGLDVLANLAGTAWRRARPFPSQSPGDGHTHSRERHEVDTGHGRVALEVFEDGVPPRWRLTNLRGVTVRQRM